VVEHGSRGFVTWNSTVDFLLLTPLGNCWSCGLQTDRQTDRQRERERESRYFCAPQYTNCVAEQGWPTSTSIQRGKVKSVN